VKISLPINRIAGDDVAISLSFTFRGQCQYCPTFISKKWIKIIFMTTFELDMQCEAGQRQLMDTQYLEAIHTLAGAEEAAWEAKDYTLLSRLYLPLQEARRQARLRCGEGVVNLGLRVERPNGELDPEETLREFSQGQFLLAGWGSIEASLRLRRLARERRLYVETFLGAVFPTSGGGRSVVIVALEEDRLPDVQPRTIEELRKTLPANALVFEEDEMRNGFVRGNSETFARVSDIWERLHLPFLRAADAEVDPIRKMEAYRKTIRVDYACELAHQGLAAVAKEMGKVSQE